MSATMGRLWAICGHGTRINRNADRSPSWHRLGLGDMPLEAKLRSQRLFPRAPRTTLNGFAPGSKLWPRCGHV
jgi:hypothetical protein